MKFSPQSEDSVTSLGLLANLRDNPARYQVWNRFVNIYSPKIRGWCVRWGLQEADAQDVTQNVLLQLAKQMHKFQYDPQGKFRSWLKTVTWRAWADYMKTRERNLAQPGTEAMFERLGSVEAKNDLMHDLEEEANRELLEVAMHNVSNRVQENTFEAFRLMTFEHLSGKEVAQRLKMSIGSVFVAKSRVDRLLSDEARRLESSAELPGAFQ